MAEQWNLTGSYFETCNCDAACPCAFMSPPTKGECTLLVGWHIKEGHFGDTALDGLNVALAAYTPGHMMEVKWKTALYVDERASDTQKEALTRIFTGKVGGHPERLASHFGEFLGVKSVPIEYQTNAKHQSLRVGDVGFAEIEDLTAEGAEEVSITARPWAIAPGYSSVVAKSDRLDFDDYDLHWHLSGENGYRSQFAYQSA